MKLAIALSLLFSVFSLVNGDGTTKQYVVYMGEHSHPNSDAVISANHEALASVMGSMNGAQQAIVHHYSKSFRGFSAMLTPDHARRLAERKEVISVFESKTNRLHTTHSWDFLGLDSISQYPMAKINAESDVIIGSIDSGVWPESESFCDEGLGPVPKRFKGECVTGENFTLANCNKKIIGARYYSEGFEAENGPLELFGGTFFRSARDSDGHGTHTASTAAGSTVARASLLGLATGIARGGAPGARLAIYKACWFNLCNDADLLSAFDDAISDGVDIISISEGPLPPQPSFFEDTNSIGSFLAFKKGILTSASVGNSGLPSTATNVAPWILTVAASSVDRRFDSDVTLGNLKTLKGQSVNPLKMNGFSGVIPASIAAATGIPSQNASFCQRDSLNPTLINSKIVVCLIESVTDNRTDKSVVVNDGGGVGMILIDPIAKDVGFQFVIPAALIGLEEAQELQAYLATEKNPTATISRSQTILHVKPAPEMAVFSSMGPNIITPDIIKPDITAPGLNILAAWSPVALDTAGGRSVNYNIISGSSMSSPHITGVAAIIKSCHPYWSPAAIKSALMTTATLIDNTGNTIVRQPNGAPTTPFDYGSGHMNPIAALNPGLVYDYDVDDMIDFLCSNGANPAQLRNITGEAIACKKMSMPSYNLNYPSIGIGSMNGSVSVYRTVTNYGSGRSVYVPKIENPTGVKVAVVPYKLKFNKTGEKLTYRVDFVPYKDSNGSFVFGAITWSDGRHVVRSPIALNVVSV
ncbi:subtilisin-like serine-protease S [Magnolia sinica]|uniref:subtilisin-like serine-protease S n=1 Tax=Magnolia sinica TaxID=86752 RepID=UPI002659A80A|nr:subtilisin-like serine-protease S [Magnolia sinica]